MTLDRKKYIQIPTWLLTIALPLIIAAITSYGIYKASNAKNEAKIEQLEKAQNEKVNKGEADVQFNLVQKSLERIENKLDQHISNGGNNYYRTTEIRKQVNR